jgi:hypothetical protein
MQKDKTRYLPARFLSGKFYSAHACYSEQVTTSNQALALFSSQYLQLLYAGGLKGEIPLRQYALINMKHKAGPVDPCSWARDPLSFDPTHSILPPLDPGSSRPGSYPGAA